MTITEVIQPTHILKDQSIIYYTKDGRNLQGKVVSKQAKVSLLKSENKGLKEFKADEAITIFWNARYWTLAKGSIFSAYMKSVTALRK